MTSQCGTMDFDDQSIQINDEQYYNQEVDEKLLLTNGLIEFEDVLDDSEQSGDDSEHSDDDVDGDDDSPLQWSQNAPLSYQSHLIPQKFLQQTSTPIVPNASVPPLQTPYAESYCHNDQWNENESGCRDGNDGNLGTHIFKEVDQYMQNQMFSSQENDNIPDQYYHHQHQQHHQQQHQHHQQQHQQPTFVNHHETIDQNDFHPHNSSASARRSSNENLHYQDFEMNGNALRSCDYQQNNFVGVNDCMSTDMLEQFPIDEDHEDVDTIGLNNSASNVPSNEDYQQQYLNQVGSRESGQFAQLEILNRTKEKKIKELSNELERVKNDMIRDMRILKHQCSMHQDEKNECRSLLSNSENSNDQLKAQLSALQIQIDALKSEKEKFMEDAKASETLIEGLKVQLVELNSMDTLSKLRQQYENNISDLKRKQESELFKVNEKLDRYAGDILEKDEDIVKLRRKLTDVVKKAEIDEINRSDIINKLTKCLHESQEHSVNSGIGNETSKLKVKLQEALAGKTLTEDLNESLKAENQELKEQIVVYESESFLHVLSNMNAFKDETGPPFEDSYAQLNIKMPRQRGNKSTKEQIESMSLFSFDEKNVNNQLKSELERCLMMYKGKKNLAASLKEKLQKLEDKLTGMTNLLEENEKKAGEKLAQAHCDGSCSTTVALKKDLQKLRAENESLISKIKDFESTIREKLSLEENYQIRISELGKQMTELVTDHDEDKKTALEQYEAKWVEHHERAVELLRFEITQELIMLKEDLTDTGNKLCRAQQLYVECCQQKDSIEEETDKKWIRITQEKENKMAEDKKLELESLRHIYETKLKKAEKLDKKVLIPKVHSFSKSIQVKLTEEICLKKELGELKHIIKGVQTSLTGKTDHVSSLESDLACKIKIIEKDHQVEKLGLEKLLMEKISEIEQFKFIIGLKAKEMQEFQEATKINKSSFTADGESDKLMWKPTQSSSGDISKLSTISEKCEQDNELVLKVASVRKEIEEELLKFMKGWMDNDCRLDGKQDTWLQEVETLLNEKIAAVFGDQDTILIRKAAHGKYLLGAHEKDLPVDAYNLSQGKYSQSEFEIFKKETETKLTKAQTKIDHYEGLIKTLEKKCEDESLSPLRKIADLNKEIYLLKKERFQFTTEIQKLKMNQKSNQIESLKENCEKIKRSLAACTDEKQELIAKIKYIEEINQKFSMENMKLQTSAQNDEVQIQKLLNKVQDLEVKIEVVEVERAKEADKLHEREKEFVEKVERVKILEEKLKKAEKLFKDMDAKTKTRLSSMQESLEREKEETVNQLKQEFVRQMELKQKEMKILEEILEGSKQDLKDELERIKVSLEEVSREKMKLERGEFGEQLKKYKEGVEIMRVFYMETIEKVKDDVISHASIVNQKTIKSMERKLVREKHKTVTNIRKYYLHALQEFLQKRFDRSFVIEMLASVEVSLDNIPSPDPEEVVSSSSSSHKTRKCPSTSNPLFNSHADFLSPSSQFTPGTTKSKEAIKSMLNIKLPSSESDTGERNNQWFSSSAGSLDDPTCNTNSISSLNRGINKFTRKEENIRADDGNLPDDFGSVYSCMDLKMRLTKEKINKKRAK